MSNIFILIVFLLQNAIIVKKSCQPYIVLWTERNEALKMTINNNYWYLLKATVFVCYTENGNKPKWRDNITAK